MLLRGDMHRVTDANAHLARLYTCPRRCLFVHVYMYIYVYICVYTCVHSTEYIYEDMYTYTYIRIHTHEDFPLHGLFCLVGARAELNENQRQRQLADARTEAAGKKSEGSSVLRFLWAYMGFRGIMENIMETTL